MMMTSDPIADMLTRIRNANTAKHDTVDIPASKIKVAIAGILVDEGFIEKYDIIEDGNFKTIRVTLKYGKGSCFKKETVDTKPDQYTCRKRIKKSIRRFAIREASYRLHVVPGENIRNFS